MRAGNGPGEGLGEVDCIICQGISRQGIDDLLCRTQAKVFLGRLVGAYDAHAPRAGVVEAVLSQ